MSPSVACVMLTKDRGCMNRRAIESFRSQAYENKALLILDTGDTSWGEHVAFRENEIHWKVTPACMTIGELRNYANEYVATWPIGSTDIFAHWDSDDWSHPNRIAEQVALLQASGAEAVGYNEMLFWDTRRGQITPASTPRVLPSGNMEFDGVVASIGEAWLYRYPNPCYALGTSLCYWRKTWERVTFDHLSHGEDQRWTTKVRCFGVSAFVTIEDMQLGPGVRPSSPQEPRMIAELHGGNTHNTDPAEKRAMFRRVPDWDAYCRKEMGS